ncbi:hypothetical protein ACMFAW_00500 [Citrobacter koseri]|uniref:phosphorylase family protein n=1 Tax=Citrobacter koseri TaxID=545 RepID=UPI003CE8DC47
MRITAPFSSALLGKRVSRFTKGWFVSYPGPNFETAAEIRMMQIIGGDVVGMSVVPEVMSARHCGPKGGWPYPRSPIWRKGWVM